MKKKHNATCERRPYPAGPDSSRPRHAIQDYTVCVIPQETSIDISKTLQLMWINIAMRMFRRKSHDELRRFVVFVEPSKKKTRMCKKLNFSQTISIKKKIIRFDYVFNTTKNARYCHCS